MRGVMREVGEGESFGGLGCSCLLGLRSWRVDSLVVS